MFPPSSLCLFCSALDFYRLALTVITTIVSIFPDVFPNVLLLLLLLLCDMPSLRGGRYGPHFCLDGSISQNFGYQELPRFRVAIRLFNAVELDSSRRSWGKLLGDASL